MQSLFIKEVRGNERGIRLFFENGVIIFFPSATAGFLLSILRLRNFAETALLTVACLSANHVYGAFLFAGKTLFAFLRRLSRRFSHAQAILSLPPLYNATDL